MPTATQEKTSRTGELLLERQRDLVDAIVAPDVGGAVDAHRRRCALGLALALWSDALLQHHVAIEESKRKGTQ